MRLATSAELREAIFAERPDAEWAQAMKRVLNVAEQQSHQYGNAWWDGADYDARVEAFVALVSD